MVCAMVGSPLLSGHLSGAHISERIMAFGTVEECFLDVYDDGEIWRTAVDLHGIEQILIFHQ